MDDHGHDGGDGALSVRLVVHLESQPISGLLRTERGTEERFVGWLGFLAALQRAHENSTKGGIR